MSATIDEMRTLLGLGPEFSDAAVAEAYALHIGIGSVTALVSEPLVTLEDARVQLQLGADSTRDVEVAGYVDDAAAWVEKFTGLVLKVKDVTEQFGGFGRMELRSWPIPSTTVPVVTYVDAAGAPIDVAGVRLDVTRRPARIVPALGGRWPSVPASTIVSVTVRVGYESPNDVPRDLRRAMLVLIAAYDADREGGDIFAKAEASARRLCSRHRVRRL